MTIGDFPKAAGTSNRHWPSHTGSMTWVRTFSPTMTNELLLTGARDYQWRGSGDAHTNYSREALGLAQPLPGPELAQSSPASALGSFPFGTGGLFWLITNYAMLQDNATKIMGKHEFQFGFHYRYEMIDKRRTPLAGPFDADTLATSLYDPASTPANPHRTAADRTWHRELLPRRHELQRRVSAALGADAQARICGILPGQLEGDAAADAQPRASLRDASADRA